MLRCPVILLLCILLSCPAAGGVQQPSSSIDALVKQLSDGSADT